MSRKYGNLETQHLYDKSHGDETEKPALPEEGEPEAEAEGEQNHESVVPEHGKAQEVHIKHDHAKGQHHVHSVHEDGHSHKAKFGSADEAHAHAGKMAGNAAEEEEAAASESSNQSDKAKAFGVE
jgi:hypothetical protein